MATTRESCSPRRPPKEVTVNKNVEWLSAPGAWTFILALIVLTWLLLSLVLDPGLAWTGTHLIHGAITYYLLHWNKGSPVQMDQARDSLPLFQSVPCCRCSPTAPAHGLDAMVYKKPLACLVHFGDCLAQLGGAPCL